MATTSDVIDCRPPVRKTPCCPDCGALECLCRPRFFAGQLLSEQDLNRLDQYIRSKNRLHNRSLHGWGVANGLLVLCDPCGEVLVTQGHAVDPCGDDIVVCEDARVNICELIRKCKQAEPQPECQPFRRPAGSSCEDLEEEWVLAIRYREWASRGATALRGNTCGSGCCPGCGSSSGCNCGPGGSCGNCGCGGGSCACGGKVAADKYRAAPDVRKNRGAPPQCEPTVTCEGYSFAVYKKPPEDDGDQDDDRLVRLQGAFWDAFECCARPLMDAIPPMPQLPVSEDGNIDLAQQGAAYSRWCCQFREKLLKYFLTQRNTNCEIIDYLRAIVCPNVNNSDSFTRDFIRSYMQLLSAWIEGLKNCLCLSLLPAPPQNTCDLRVPLATVRIRARDCKVLSICNWTRERKIMLTWPAVSHWLSIVPLEEFIRELIDRLCCNSLLGIFDDLLGDIGGSFNSGDVAGTSFAQAQDTDFASGLHLASGILNTRFSANLDSKIAGFSELAAGVMGRGDQPLELGALLNAASPRFRTPDNGQKLNAVESKNIPLLLVSEFAVKPMLASLLGSNRAENKIAEFQAGLGKGAKKSADVQQQLDEMRRKMQEQEKQLKSLMKKVGK